MEVNGQLARTNSSFYHVGLRDQTQVVRLGTFLAPEHPIYLNPIAHILGLFRAQHSKASQIQSCLLTSERSKMPDKVRLGSSSGTWSGDLGNFISLSIDSVSS